MTLVLGDSVRVVLQIANAIISQQFNLRAQQAYARITALLLVTALSTAFASNDLQAQSVTPPPIAAGDAFSAGDIAVTGFAGAKLQVQSLPPGVAPVSKTVVDPDGVTLRIYDAATFGAPAGGQMISPQTKLELKAREIGHVFALAFDSGSPDRTTSPALYAAATSAFGLNIVGPDKDGDGKPDRLGKGAPGATFMDGQFGSQAGAGPGTIWKIDRATGAVSVFANVQTKGTPNSGAGIGGLAIDAASKSLYASDLETGLIHRYALAEKGADVGVFDHGFVGRPARGKPVVKDDGARLDITSPEFDPAQPATWKYTAPERRVHGLAVHDSRLYYAVAEDSEIWSVGLEANGAFKLDPRFEVGIDAAPSFPFTGIVFDRDGHMILAQRGSVENPADYSSFASSGPSKVLRLTADPAATSGASARWKLEVDEYAVSSAEGHRASSGGVATHYGYKPDGSIDLAVCNGTLAVSADALGDKRAVHGVQLADVTLVRPANVPPNQSVFINWDARQDDPVARGYTGGVASFQDCSGGAGFPAVAADGGAGLPPVADGGGGGGTFPPVDGGGAVAPPIDETLPPIDEGGGGGKTLPLQVVKTADAATCSPKGGCAFSITVTNPNAEDVAGPIVIDEQIDAPQATLTGEPNAPWTCTKAAPFTCTHPGPIPANASVDMRVVFAPNTPPEIKTVKNCAILQGAAAALPEQCPTIALDPDAPVQTGPIIASKKSTSACTAKGPCTFTITVTNNSDAEVKGPIVIDEQIDAPQAALVDAQPNAPWTCEKAAPFSCTHPGPFAAKQSVDLTLSFIPNTPPETTSLKNCAIVKQPPPVAPAKQLAPDKKTEAPLPFGRNSLVQHASFHLLAPAKFQSLIQRTGGAGGNLGGVSCLQWKAPPAFSIRQANGTVIEVTNVGGKESFFGDVRIFDGTTGRLSGGVTNGNGMSFSTTWSDGKTGKSRGSFDANGVVTGTTRNEVTGEIVNFTGMQPWPCAENNICRDYADKAMTQVAGFKAKGCWPLPLQMSEKRDDHVTFCMGPHDAPIEGEHETRDQQIAACKPRLAGDPVPLPPPPPPPFEPITKLKIKPPPEPGAAPAPEQCATVPIGPPVPEASAAGPLSLVKTAGPGSCKATSCDFTISVTNTAQTPFDGPVEFFDEISVNGLQLGGEKLTAPQPWACPGVNGFVCTGTLKLAANEKKDFVFTVVKDLSGEKTAKEINILKNCATLKGAPERSCATATLAGPPTPQPARTNKLIFAKNPVASKCSDFGGGCEYLISITNPGPEDFSGPLEFGDVVKTPDNRPLPNATFPTSGMGALRQDGVTADFLCNKSGDGILCRTTGDAKIPANRTAQIPAIIKPGPVAGATAVKNCATLTGGDGEKCATIPLVDGPLLRASKATAAKSCVPDCAFGVRIENFGNTDAKGNFVLTDIFTPASSIAEITKIDGDFNCGRQGDEFVCAATKGIILPGQSINGRVLVKANAKLQEYKNCVEVRSDNKSIQIDTDHPSHCVTVKDNAPHLAIVKTGTPTCDLKKSCEFGIIITNNGAGQYNGPIVFTDEVPAVTDDGKAQPVPAGVESFADPDWTCTKPTVRSIICTNKAQTLAPGKSVTLKVIVTPGPDWKKNDVLMNCGTIASPIGNDPGFNPKDRKSCFGTQLDPFAVKVEKSGGQNCQPGGECKFTISVFNPGPIDHVAPVTITDQLTGISSASIVSITPVTGDKFPCNPAPTQIPFTCTSPGNYPLLLGPNGEPSPRKVFDMVVKLPPDAKAFTNCAAAIDPTSGSPTSGTKTSCVSVETKPAETPKDSSKCSGGMVLNAAGACACPPDTSFNGRSCSGGGSNGVQPPPVVVTPPPVVVVPAPPVGCLGGMVLTAGACSCPPGTRFSGRACVDDGSGGSNAAKSVEDDDTPPPPVKTRPPTVEDDPVCPRSRPVGEYPNCCPVGTKFKKGACRSTRPDEPSPVIKPKNPECPRSRPIGEYPDCCPEGTRFRRGACRPDRQEKVPPPQPNCPASRPVGDYPNCCPSGMRFIAGACRRLGVPQPSPQQNVKTCPDGTKVFGKYTPCPSVRPRPQPQPTPQLNVKTCPDGTKVFGKYTQCPSVKPRPTPPPAQKKCEFGLPPSCTCPPGKDPVQGGCRSSLR